MRARGVTFLFGLALIHISLAVDSKDLAEESVQPFVPKLDSDYVINLDGLFSTKLDLLLEYSYAVMMDCTGDNCHYYKYCVKLADDIVCMTVRLDKPSNQTDEEKGNPEEKELDYKSGYIFDDDNIFAEKSDVLIRYSAEIMKWCTTEPCRSYVLCYRMGDNKICMAVWFTNSKDEFFNTILHHDNFHDPSHDEEELVLNREQGNYNSAIDSRDEPSEATDDKGEPSEATDNNGEPSEATDKDEPSEATDKGEPSEATNHKASHRNLRPITTKPSKLQHRTLQPSEANRQGRAIEATEKRKKKGEPSEATDKGEPSEATDKGEPSEATDKGEPSEATDKGEPSEATDKGEPSALRTMAIHQSYRQSGRAIRSYRQASSEATRQGRAIRITSLVFKRKKYIQDTIKTSRQQRQPSE
ncbi:hypothetical protein GDO81_004565 [Engystomops pustulosus]|uniref:Uncharacterized protein n=1 Tax=Engystomops pustulosus TaxID=76066 RepID=A0AAV6ZY98_ENGPU|nr:hypothetical protein GDO81_004565 [Engystomops pustulosus]